MDRPHLIRRLCITVSVFFALVALALCVLWMRSYWRRDMLDRSAPNNSLICNSNNGYLLFAYFPNNAIRDSRGNEWSFHSDDATLEAYSTGFARTTNAVVCTAHYSLIALPAAIAACVPWVSRRFSLRTLLIATTLVAVALGLGVCAAG